MNKETEREKKAKKELTQRQIHYNPNWQYLKEKAKKY